MWWWLSTVSSGAAVLLLMRWMFHVARPADDLARLASWFSGARRWAAVQRVRLLDALGVTGGAWRLLRYRYQHGGFGELGT